MLCLGCGYEHHCGIHGCAVMLAAADVMENMQTENAALHQIAEKQAVMNVNLTKKIAKELLDKGWCRVTGLYTPKRPQLYDAIIRLDDTGGKYVSFKMEFEK